MSHAAWSWRWSIAIGIVLFLSGSISNPQGSAVAASLNPRANWILVTEFLPHPVKPAKREYSLWNETIQKPLRYGKRKFGINLVWGGAGWEKTIMIKRAIDHPKAEPPRDVGPNVTFGSGVAIFVKGGGYLVYKKRKSGINLGWTGDDLDWNTYQWRFESLGDKGPEEFRTKKAVALFNTVAKAYLVYGKRKSGIDLKWYRPR